MIDSVVNSDYSKLHSRNVKIFGKGGSAPFRDLKFDLH